MALTQEDAYSRSRLYVVRRFPADHPYYPDKYHGSLNGYTVWGNDKRPILFETEDDAKQSCQLHYDFYCGLIAAAPTS